MLCRGVRNALLLSEDTAARLEIFEDQEHPITYKFQFKGNKYFVDGNESMHYACNI